MQFVTKKKLINNKIEIYILFIDYFLLYYYIIIIIYYLFYKIKIKNTF